MKSDPINAFCWVTIYLPSFITSPTVGLLDGQSPCVEWYYSTLSLCYAVHEPVIFIFYFSRKSCGDTYRKKLNHYHNRQL